LKEKPSANTSSECSLCTAPPEEIEQSDANRQEVRSLQDKVIELAQKGEFHKALESVDRLFLLADQEGMREAVPVDIVEIAARLYYLVGDLEKAIEWTRKLQHEISGYGVPNELGQQKLKLLESVMKRLERELAQKKAQEEE
jgi:ribosomal protein L17